MMVKNKSLQLQGRLFCYVVIIILLLYLLCSEYAYNKQNNTFEEKIKNILKILENAHIKEVIRCDFGFEEGSSLVVLTKDPIETYKDCIVILRETNSGYKLVFRYSDRYGYSCIFLADGNDLLRIPGLVTIWAKFSDQALVIFYRRGDKIVPIFQKLGGVFITEFGDVNNDGLTDILISELEWTITKGSHVRKPKMTKIYLRRVNESGDWFIFWKKVPWRFRWKAYKVMTR